MVSCFLWISTESGFLRWTLLLVKMLWGLLNVQLLSHILLFGTPWTAARQTSLSSLSLGVCSNSCPLSQWCHPTISSSVPASPLALNLSSIQVFFNELAVPTSWPKYWSSARASVFQWTFRVDFLQDWLVWSPCSPRDSQESLGLSSTIVRSINSSAFFMVQLSHTCMTTGETIVLTT